MTANTEGFSTTRPTKDGWYKIIFNPGEDPMTVYLHVTEYGISWGFDESDDPEAIEVEAMEVNLIQFRETASINVDDQTNG